MDHVVYIDAKEGDLEKLLDGKKRMIIRGATGRKLPYGRVEVGDQFYFIQNDGKCLVQASASVSMVINSELLSPDESSQLIEKYQDLLQLSPSQVKRWAGKRYLVLMGIENVKPVKPFSVDRSEYGNMDDWLPVGDIQRVKVNNSKIIIP
ncbi:MAG: hypothetical protein Q7U53_07725 [Anaerolineaceae bacterium]|nr:hypothetical protein [Anaerolineaceae bacterium]